MMKRSSTAHIFVALLFMLPFTLSTLLPAAAEVDPDAVTLVPVSGRLFSTKFSPDESTVAMWDREPVGMDDPTRERAIRMVDLETGEEWSLDAATDFTNDVAFTSDGTVMASTHPNGDVNIWYPDDGTLIKTIRLLFPVDLAQFLDDDQTLVLMAGSFPQYFIYLNIGSEAITRIVGQHFDQASEFRQNYVQAPAIFDVLYSHFHVTGDGNDLFAANANGDVLLWEAGIPFSMVIHQAPDMIMGGYDIRAMAVVDDEQNVIVYDRALNQLTRLGETAVLPGGSTFFAVAPDGHRIAWVQRETATVMLGDFDAPDTVETLYTLPENLQDPSPSIQMMFTSDGSQLLIGGLVASDAQNAIIVIDLSE